MAYIDQTYYENTYVGTTIPTEDFPKLSERASSVIDMLTYNRASGRTAEKFVSAIKTATAIETEYLYVNGGVMAFTGNGNNVKKSENIGNYSYSRNFDGMLSVNGIPVSPLCIAVLDSVGLRYPGVDF